MQRRGARAAPIYLLSVLFSPETQPIYRLEVVANGPSSYLGSPDNSLDGRYQFTLPEPLARGELRALRDPNDPVEQVFDLLTASA